MNSIKSYYILFLVFILFFSSCGLDEHPQYDLKFIHIMANESSSITVSSKANVIGTYNVYLSSSPTSETVTVTYEVIAGNGLKEGVDYKLLSDNTVTFLPVSTICRFDQWIANIDPTKIIR